ncbi:FUSC family protein [Georgenia sp. Z1491]|uniref:FUSC family protein n=1 Tax=Georgenia sp. Z1491 TaxID=3416707 RepID=UPI003CF5A826
MGVWPLPRSGGCWSSRRRDASSRERSCIQADGRSADPGTRRLAGLLRRPDVLTELTQIAKGVVAATMAWWFSVQVLESALPFLAPWTALLTVHATVFRSMSSGVQLTLSSAIGVGLSFLVGSYLGVSVWTFALAILVGLAVARTPTIRDEGVAIATTAIFVLGSGFDDQESLLLDRIMEVGVGVGVGLVVNLLIIPPLRDRQASQHVDSVNRQMGQVLVEMADEFSESWDTDKASDWFGATESMSRSVERAWGAVGYARESRRINLRLYRPDRRSPASRGRGLGYEDILPRLDEGVSHLRNLARTLYNATYAEGEWDAHFRERWVGIVRDCGRAVADPDAEVEPVADRLEMLAGELSRDRKLPESTWPVYGALITSVRHVAVVVDDIASARAAREAGSSSPRA